MRRRMGFDAQESSASDQEMTISQRIAAFHQGRDPEILPRKFELMRQDAFGFLRGSCFLFYEDLLARHLPDSPLVWCCGDLHLQNFGTFKGDNRLAYFDLNDFDECALAPAAWELVRCCASILVAGPGLKLSSTAAQKLAAEYLDAYAAALRHGKALWLERATADGPIGRLLAGLKNRKQRRFLRERVDHQRIRTNTGRVLPVSQAQFTSLRELLLRLRYPGRLLDAGRRIAGLGSLGLERYVLLVSSNGESKATLLDLKVQPGSALRCAPDLPHQPRWASEGERVCAVQHWCQAVSPALLQPVKFQERSFVLHELMPTADRLSLAHLSRRPPEMTNAIRDMGALTAWSHLRSAARQGAALPLDLIGFGRQESWRPALLVQAGAAAKNNFEQWARFNRELS